MNNSFGHLLQLISALLYPLLLLWQTIREQIHTLRLAKKIPGRRGLPLLGNVLEIGRDSESISKYIEEDGRRFGTIFASYVGPFLVVGTANKEDLEDFLSGHVYLRKGFLYEFLKPWLGTGLLMSTGKKWHTRRKILTPAFHFQIIEQFIPVFNRCGDEFITQLRKRANGEAFDVWFLSKLLTLDIICETTMGVHMKAQTQSESAYVNAVNEMGKIVFQHGLSPWLYPQFIFRFSRLGRRFKACLEILHATTNKVIRERREELQKLSVWNEITNIDELGRRRRVAFLDLLLLAARDGSLTDADIREEVDTFMFEGHDTTASAISFTLYLLSLHEDIQEKIFEELITVFDSSKPLQPTLQQLSQLVYTEMVIKESLRLYPPVPGASRAITKDYPLPSNGLIIPRGSELFANIVMLHRNEDVFPDPLTFDPDRFSSDECARRHPFAYLPFSAGPRNCIGQRFAMLEVKNTIAKVIWNFHLRPDPHYTPTLVWELVLKTNNGVYLKLEERKK